MSTDEGGRTHPMFSGYRPQFFYDGNDWDAVHTYVGVDQVNPGDTVKTMLTFPRPENHHGRIHEGLEFLIREGSRTVGRGRVLRILDPSLRADA